MRFRKSDPAKDPAMNEVAADAVVTDTATDAAAALALAEAEAAAAEATAAAARARAEQIRLRKQGAARPETAEEPEADPDVAEAAEGDDSDEPAEETEAVGGAEVTASAEEYQSIAPAQPQRGLGSTLRWAAAALVVLLTGALITVSVLMVVQHRGVEAKARQAAEYVAAAKQSVVTLMSLDFNSVDEDVQRILDNSTGDFREEFEAQAKDFATVAKESKVVTEATATAAAVESMTDNDAVVLVTATSTVSNTAGAEQEPRSWRLAVSLARDGDQIKMSKVEFAP